MTNVGNILLLSSRMSHVLVSVKQMFCGVFFFIYIGHIMSVSILQSTALYFLLFGILKGSFWSEKEKTFYDD